MNLHRQQPIPPYRKLPSSERRRCTLPNRESGRIVYEREKNAPKNGPVKSFHHFEKTFLLKSCVAYFCNLWEHNERGCFCEECSELDSGVNLMRGQEKGMRVDGWMVVGGAKKGVRPSVRHPSIRFATAIRMRNPRRGEGETHTYS